jgi:putative addiction module killer protein
MKEIRETDEYKSWFENLKDKRAKTRIDIRIKRLALGNPGVVKPIGEGCSELIIDYGPGYRVYFKDTGKVIIILLYCGNKSTQSKDIEQAKKIWRNMEV